jgi:gas vesicle protein
MDCAVVNMLRIRRPPKVRGQEYQPMNTHTQEHRDYGFVIGLLTGTFVGAGLAMWFAPPSALELRRRTTDAARRLGKRISQQDQPAGTSVAEAVDELTRTGQDVGDDVADAVARGAHEVERDATAAKTDRVAQTRKHSPADRVPSTPHSL